MLDQPRRRAVARHDHVVTDCGDLEQLGGEGERQPDAAVRGGITGHDARVQRRAGPGDPVHPGHRRAAIEVGVVQPPLFENAENAGLGGVAAHSGGYAGARDQRQPAINIDLLAAQRDDERHRLAIGRIREYRFGRLRGVLSFPCFGGQRRTDRCDQHRHAKKSEKCRRPPSGGRSRPSPQKTDTQDTSSQSSAAPIGEPPCVIPQLARITLKEALLFDQRKPSNHLTPRPSPRFCRGRRSGSETYVSSWTYHPLWAILSSRCGPRGKGRSTNKLCSVSFAQHFELGDFRSN